MPTSGPVGLHLGLAWLNAGTRVTSLSREMSPLCATLKFQRATTKLHPLNSVLVRQIRGESARRSCVPNLRLRRMGVFRPLTRKLVAELDLVRGHYRILEWGLPVAWHPEYNRLLRERKALRHA